MTFYGAKIPTNDVTFYKFLALIRQKFPTFTYYFEKNRFLEVDKNPQAFYYQMEVFANEMILNGYCSEIFVSDYNY